MAPTKFLPFCSVFVLLLLAGSGAALVSATTAIEEEDHADPVDQLDAFAKRLLENNDFAEDEALLQADSVGDLLFFSSNASSTDEQSATGSAPPQVKANDVLAALRQGEGLQYSPAEADSNSGAAPRGDKSIAQHEAKAGVHNKNLITSVLTRLVSLATARNKVSRTVSAAFNLLEKAREHVAGTADAVARLEDLLEELTQLQSRFMDLADSFIVLLKDAINIVTKHWEGTTRDMQQSHVLQFFESLLASADAAKQASVKQWELIQAWCAPQKKTTQHQAITEEVRGADRLRGAKTGQEPRDQGAVDTSSSSDSVGSLHVLFTEVEQARQIARDAAQSAWHHATECAREGFMPLPVVSVLLGES